MLTRFTAFMLDADRRQHNVSLTHGGMALKQGGGRIPSMRLAAFTN